MDVETHIKAWYQDMVQRQTVYDGESLKKWDSDTSVQKWVVWSDYLHWARQSVEARTCSMSRPRFFKIFDVIASCVMSGPGPDNKPCYVFARKGLNPCKRVLMKSHITLKEKEVRQASSKSNKRKFWSDPVAEFCESLQSSRVLKVRTAEIVLDPDTGVDLNLLLESFRELGSAATETITEQKFKCAIKKVTPCGGFGKYPVPKEQRHRTAGATQVSNIIVLGKGEEPAHVRRNTDGRLIAGTIPLLKVLYHSDTIFLDKWLKERCTEEDGKTSMETLFKDYCRFSASSPSLVHFRAEVGDRHLALKELSPAQLTSLAAHLKLSAPIMTRLATLHGNELRDSLASFAKYSHTFSGASNIDLLHTYESVRDFFNFL